MLGRAADADVLLRAIESGAVTKIHPVGILSPSPADRGQAIRGVSVLGDPDDIERIVADLGNRGINVTRLVLTPSALEPEAKPETILMRARRLGLATSRLPSLDDGGEALRLAPVNVEDLLLRPGVKIDYRRLETFVKGKSIIVTGGGGSIGAEICDRIVTFGAARVLVIENSEPALHAVLEMLATKRAGARSKAALPTSATATASSAWSLIFGPTSCSMRRRSSTCRCSSGTGGKASRPTCSARSMSPTPRPPPAPPPW